MKPFLFSAAVFLLLLTCVCVNAVLVSDSVGETISEVRALPRPDVTSADRLPLLNEARAVSNLRAEWKNRLRFVSLTVNHNDLMAVNAQFATLEGAAKAGDAMGYVTALEVLEESLEHLRRLSGIRPEVVF